MIPVLKPRGWASGYRGAVKKGLEYTRTLQLRARRVWAQFYATNDFDGEAWSNWLDVQQAADRPTIVSRSLDPMAPKRCETKTDRLKS